MTWQLWCYKHLPKVRLKIFIPHLRSISPSPEKNPNAQILGLIRLIFVMQVSVYTPEPTFTLTWMKLPGQLKFDGRSLVTVKLLILSSCLQVAPSPHNFNSDLLTPTPPPLRDLKVSCP